MARRIDFGRFPKSVVTRGGPEVLDVKSPKERVIE